MLESGRSLVIIFILIEVSSAYVRQLVAFRRNAMGDLLIVLK